MHGCSSQRPFFGRSNFGQSILGSGVCHGDGWGPEGGGGVRRVGPRTTGGPKFRSFFLSCSHVRSREVFSWNCGRRSLPKSASLGFCGVLLWEPRLPTGRQALTLRDPTLRAPTLWGPTFSWFGPPPPFASLIFSFSHCLYIFLFLFFLFIFVVTFFHFLIFQFFHSSLIFIFCAIFRFFFF